MNAAHTAARAVTTDCDVVVVGGGLVGACAAALLVRHAGIDPQRVVLLERNLPAVLPPDAPFDLRVSTLSLASLDILRAAGAAAALDTPRVGSFERMHVWHEGQAPFDGQALIFDAADLALPRLGVVVENRLVQNALIEAFTAAGGRLERAGVESLVLAPECATLQLGGTTLTTRLVVGADGAASLVRRQAQLEAEELDLGQVALVANVATAKPHDHTAWQVFLRTGPLAFLPLADGTSSIVWSCTTQRARELAALSATELAQQLDAASQLALGHTRLVSERASFPLRSLAAARYVTERCALVGDAAHVVHPLAGQGVNLGLMDAALLVEHVAAGRATREDPGALRLLRRYERSRKAGNALMAQVIDAFDRAFGSARPFAAPVTALARHALPLAGRNREARRLFMRRALGLDEKLPAYIHPTR